MTSSMALVLSSGVYFEGVGLLLCNPVPSIKPGAIHHLEGPSDGVTVDFDHEDAVVFVESDDEDGRVTQFDDPVDAVSTVGTHHLVLTDPDPRILVGDL
ncbi:MAG: hypothetical protein WAX28_14065 [Corynebacterium variabile]|uniref:hypothetical protein n=1 Tax=Corynebacterium variabile TaxID=1727 RepID=UPI003BB762DD